MPNIYVQSMDGKPLMPIHSYGRAKRFLKTGKARIVCYQPFVIRLTYETTTNVQHITLGIDPGRTNIGLSAIDETGRCLYMAKCETRNKEVPKLMSERKQHRQASRRGERLRRKRRAKRAGTYFQKTKMGDRPVWMRYLPHCEKPVTLYEIKNSESRFCNRKRSAGRLNPTVTQLLRTHKNLVHLVEKVLPVTKIVLELNKFAFMAMDNPYIHRWEYRVGPMHGYQNHMDALCTLQNNTCLLCGKNPITEKHHIIPRSQRGSDTLANLAGLCKKCHEKVHKDEKAKERLAKKKKGQNKKYGALSVLNQIIPFLLNDLQKLYPDHVFITNGWDTLKFREEHGVVKNHDNDAYCIACSSLEGEIVPDIPDESFCIRQFRRHNRQRIHKQSERTYFLDGEKVATNRHKRTAQVDTETGKETKQKTDSLEEWYQKAIKLFGEKEAMRQQSRLKVRKSMRSIRSEHTMRLMPGAKFLYSDKRIYTLSGNHGQYNLRAVGEGTREFKRKECTILVHNQGLVYM